MNDQTQREVRFRENRSPELTSGCLLACLRRDSAAGAIPIDEIQLVWRALRTGGCTVVPDDFSRAAASDQLHGVWRTPAQHVVASHPTVLLAYQQYRRLVEAVASSPDILIQKDTSKVTIKPDHERRIKRIIHPTRNSHTFL